MILTATSQEKLVYNNINPAHLTEWVEGSAVAENIAQLAIESLTTEELNERIQPKNPIKTGGWWVRGVNWRTGVPMGNRYGQGKPDELHQIAEGKKPVKYMTASGMEPDAIFLAMPDQDFWINTYADKAIPCIWTEGAKKAGAGLSIGLPTIALTGVWNWGKGGQLASDVKKWAQPGRSHVIAFDSDYAAKSSCREAIRRFVRLLEAEGCKVKIAVWSSEFKGMDDFIKANGGDAFKEKIASAITIERWEKQLQKLERESKLASPKSSQILAAIAEDYRGKLAWNIQVREWFEYERKQQGIWAKAPKEAVEKLVRKKLKVLVPGGYSYRFLTDTISLLKSELMIEEWDTDKSVIPLQNGVLDKQTKKLSPHAPNYRLTYCLPFEYDITATCDPVINWLQETVAGDVDLVQFLLAYLNAVVNRRADLQRYLELIGPGGTGKSTYMKLATALVGGKNTHTTKHQLLEESRFETANLYGKSLALVTEADQYVGAVNVLKAITGQDKLHYERKMEQAGDGFEFEGMVITAGNEPSRSADYTSGLARRKIAVWFRNHVPSHKRRDLDSEFKQYLPGLLNLVLTFSDEEVTRLIRDAETFCPTLKNFQRETLCETNPIADWLDNKLVRLAGSRITPGSLYEKFKAHCDETGQKPVSLKRFSGLLIDLCQVQLGWHDVKKGRDRLGRFITGLALRADGDFSPFPVTELFNSDSVTDEMTNVTDSMTAETTALNGCDGCDTFLEDDSPQIIFEPDKKNENVVIEQENEVLSVTRHASITSPATVELREVWVQAIHPQNKQWTAALYIGKVKNERSYRVRFMGESVVTIAAQDVRF